MPGTVSQFYTEDQDGSTRREFSIALTVISSVSLFCSVACIVVFVVLLAFNSHRVNIPLVKITMSIQSVHVIALIITLLLNQVHIRAELLCSTLRYILYSCYLTSIFMCCAITIHLWLVITRRKLNQTKRNERWYFIIPFTLAISLSAALAVIPNSAYKIPNRCLIAKVPSHEYLGIRWGLYYGWFVISAALSMMCMVSVLFSARKLTHSTHLRGRTTPSSTEAYRGAVNARANSKRLRSLVFYTIAYPLISLVCNFPQLIFELLSATTKRQIQGLGFASRLLLYSEGMFLSLAFFLYPAVLHSIRDINHSAVQYWVVEQEEYWRLKNSEMKHTGRTNLMSEDRSEMLVDRRDIKNFTSLRGRIYHFVFSRTSEGMRASGR